MDDGFMSGSMDKTVRLWDLRTPNCRGLLNLPATPVVAYDASGLVFAVGVNQYSRILLYDQANYDKAPFLVMQDADIDGGGTQRHERAGRGVRFEDGHVGRDGLDVRAPAAPLAHGPG